MLIESELSSKQMSLEPSSDHHKVYPDEPLLETVGNLFPRIDTFEEPQVADVDAANYQTVRETPKPPGQLGIAPGPDQLRQEVTVPNAYPVTDVLEIADIVLNLPDS